jgi:hypothetical protein
MNTALEYSTRERKKERKKERIFISQPQRIILNSVRRCIYDIQEITKNDSERADYRTGLRGTAGIGQKS